MKRFQFFCWRCAGANLSILAKCPSETSKYVGIGASVFFTGLFAALAAGYALFTVFDNYVWAVVFGLLWGMMIFNLDRFIVSSMRKNGDQRKEWLTALPRIFLAILISFVVARPLELKIFEKEINNEIAMMIQEDKAWHEAVTRRRLAGDRNRLTSEIEQLKAEILSKTQKRDELRKIAQQEADGTGGSMQRNAGPIYQIKKADADRIEEELGILQTINTRLITEKTMALQTLTEQEAVALAQITDSQLTGLASRIEALDRLTEKSEAIALAHFFLLLLFILMETAPIFVKLISNRGPYDYVLRKEEYSYESSYYEDLAKVNAIIKKRTHRLSKEEMEYVTNRLDLSLEQT